MDRVYKSLERSNEINKADLLTKAYHLSAIHAAPTPPRRGFLLPNRRIYNVSKI